MLSEEIDENIIDQLEQVKLFLLLKNNKSIFVDSIRFV